MLLQLEVSHTRGMQNRYTELLLECKHFVPRVAHGMAL